MNGSFVYTVGSGAVGQPIGTTDAGTLTAYVGQPYPISGLSQFQTDACGVNSAYYCNGIFEAGLAGSVKWRITGITRGATYTSASGTIYN
jgi:hypothetical protein